METLAHMLLLWWTLGMVIVYVIVYRMWKRDMERWAHMPWSVPPLWSSKYLGDWVLPIIAFMWPLVAINDD